jgi:lipid A 4'-phosphatase
VVRLTPIVARFHEPNREEAGVRAFAFVLIGLAVVATVVSLLGPNVDLAVARLFFDPSTGRFPTASCSFLAGLRDRGYVSIFASVGILVAALATRWLPPTLGLNVPGRVAVYLAASLALGSGVLTNLLFKDHWHRPRPVAVTEFGGTEAFVNWWNPTGACDRNCSFASGDVAAAAWLFGPAVLAPPPWRTAAVAGATIFTIVIALGRMAAGAHFLTDVIFGALMSLFALWFMQTLMLREARRRFIERTTRAVEHGIRHLRAPTGR